MSSAPGEAFGPYLVHEELGFGGMAQVHRAEVIGIEGFTRSVALKRMLEHVAANDDMVKAFVREARLASYMRHRNVAQTYELGKVGDIYYIAMELVTGYTLREVLKHCGATTGPMPVSVALNILNQICDALDYAHHLCDETGQALGIIHRDVSPSNIIVNESGVVKLIDFGIAKASAAGMQTMSGTIKGKFGYMAPEYIAGSIDARADLFAVGVIAHELLTNRPLFSGPDDMETLQRVMKMEIVPPSRFNSQVPSDIDDIVMTALERDPERRWQHATALRSALTTLTKRLDLVVSDGQVIEWLTWALEQTKPRSPNLRSQLPAHAEITHVSSAVELITPATEVHSGRDFAGVIDDGLDDGPEILITPAAGTPSRATPPPRHDALHPTGSRLVGDDHVPTLVHASRPNLELPRPPMGPQMAGPLPQTSGPLSPPGTLEGARQIETTLRTPRPARLSGPHPGPPKKSSPLVPVVLVLLAAAIAAAAVYFALPLLT